MWLACLHSARSQTNYKVRLVSGLTGKPIKSGYIYTRNDNLIGATDTLGYFTVESDSLINAPIIFFSEKTGWTAIDKFEPKKGEVTVLLLSPQCLYSAEDDIAKKKNKDSC